VKTAVGEKSFFLPGKALPADIAPFVCRRYERVVMLHFAIAFFASNGRAIGYLGIDFFNHLAVSSYLRFR
jgi:hypothetical protein